MASTPPPGWYPDPYGMLAERWWDGERWAGSPEKLGPRQTPASSNSVGRQQFSRAQGSAATGASRFVGGMNVPTKFGSRLNATVPLAVLTVDRTSFVLHPRSFPVPMFSDFRVALSDIAVAFRLGGGPLASGVGIQLTDGNVAYFWTMSKHDGVLSTLDQFGVQVDPTTRRASGAILGQFGWLRFWKLGQVASVAELPGLSRLMMLISPLLTLAGLVFAVSCILGIGGSPGWFGGVVGILGTLFGVRMWLASRAGPPN